MAALLSQQMPVFVKAYSFNGLATLGFRGSSAAQSQVFWNGVPIQNAALGIADISTLPVLFISRANIVYGGSGALFGSGNVGGALMLENDRPLFDTSLRKLSISAGAGSFGQYSGGLKAAIANDRWYVAGSAFTQRATNNYNYITAAGNEAKMPNSSLQSGAIMLQAAYKADSYNTIELSAWAQQYDRHIPPALFEPYSVKEQQDNALRLVAGWQQVKATYTLYAKASLIQDGYTYSDTAVQLYSHGSVQQYFHEIGWKRPIGRNGTLLLFSPVQVSWMPGAADSQRQQRAALAGAYSIKALQQRLNVSVQARTEHINTTGIFLPGAGATYRIGDALSLRANAQRTYRMPTLNELYYFPGGNPSLRPEQGSSQDAGYTLNVNRGHFTLHHDAAIFNRNIKDWIMWLGGAIWTPHNIASVHSRGTETDNRLTYTSGDWQWHLAVSTSYVLATTTESYMPADGSIGQQIPYTPRYNARGNIGLTWKRLYLNYNHTYTGYRFITTDASAWLEPYSTGNVQAMYSLRLYKRNVQLNAQCNNIWNAHYSVAGFRPMPGINWLAGLKLEL